MAGPSAPLGRDAFLTLLRTTIALLPALLIAGVVWYLGRGYSTHEHLEVVGFLAVSTLAVLAIATLHPALYPRCGRLALLAFAFWAATSAFWRGLAFFHVLTAEERLAANSVVASVLAIAGIYTLWGHHVATAMWHYALDNVVQGGSHDGGDATATDGVSRPDNGARPVRALPDDDG